MAKSYKLKDGNYIDSGSISHNRKKLNEVLGITLYEDPQGTNANVTLSESAENFDYLEIYFARHGGFNTFSSVKIFNPHEKHIDLSLVHSSNSETMQIIGGRVLINGTLLTRENTTLVQINNLTVISHIDYTDLYIFKVIGYK